MYAESFQAIKHLKYGTKENKIKTLLVFKTDFLAQMYFFSRVCRESYVGRSYIVFSLLICVFSFFHKQTNTHM